MVTWQTFVEIGFDVAERKGAQFAGIDDGAEFMTALASVWRRDKDTYKQLTREQTRNKLKEIVEA